MLLRRVVALSLLPLSALLVAQTSTEPHGQLPVRRVVLYKNGVGYFEHAGRVTGNQALTIDFTSSQLDDALQSLTALDLGGGRITGVGYNSTTPLEQQLKNIPLGLDDQPSTEELYGALRGARVEVSGPGEAALAGRIVSYETRSAKDACGRHGGARISDGGERCGRGSHVRARGNDQCAHPGRRPAARPGRIPRSAGLHAEPAGAAPDAAGAGYGHARHSRELHQRSAGVEEHVPHCFPGERQIRQAARDRRRRSCRDGRWSTTRWARTGTTCSFRWLPALRKVSSSRFRSRFTRSGLKCPFPRPRTLLRLRMRGRSRFLLPHRRRRLLPRASWSTARIRANCKRSRRSTVARRPS